ncbi:hypothetical protein WJX73_008485 [Symbiochloris irregularis]|uniref:Uncharacterized protein n=1 Tax=Symbiochloris irregularis TaxID=706552 RepID=A0AAW1PAX7_9CHLO
METDSRRLQNRQQQQSALKQLLAAKRAKEDRRTEKQSQSERPDTGRGEQQKPCLASGQGSFELDGRISKGLFWWQLDGIKWLWNLHQQPSGGILADDMGLGKTRQCSAFLAGMFTNKLISRVLIVAPKTLLATWDKELTHCGLDHVTQQYTGSVDERDYALRRVMRRRGILLTTYGMVQRNAGCLAEAPPGCDRRDPETTAVWDWVLLDEGHTIKNSRSQTSQQLATISASHRLIITGTPMQNHLMELHTLVDFVCPGLLGDARDFKLNFAGPITAGTDKHASPRTQADGAEQAELLHSLTEPVMLRREKRNVLMADASAQGRASTSEGLGKDAAGHAETPRTSQAQPQFLRTKNDLVVWLRLQDMQQRVYQAFLNSKEVKSVLNDSNSPLAACNVLRKICSHPALLNQRTVNMAARAGERLVARHAPVHVEEEDGLREDWGRTPEVPHSAAAQEPTASQQVAADLAEWAGEDAVGKKLLADLRSCSGSEEKSCKTVFAMTLLQELCEQGERSLVFSQSRVMLDILQDALGQRDISFLRIDGTVAKASDRQDLVQQYQEDSSISVFLLTTKVGGLGLTLTAATRVIILEPDWNPSMDDQSVDRAYRMGQMRDVVVYRLITCGTVEEKIYRRQVFKGGLSRSARGASTLGYFSHQELRDLFSVKTEELEQSTTQQQLHAMHAGQRKTSPALHQHLEFLSGLDGFRGISDHDLLFSGEFLTPAPSAPNEPACGPYQPEVFPLGPAAVGRKGRHAEPKGGDISDLFSRALTLKDDRAQTSSGQREAALRKKIATLQASLGLALPDGGARVLKKIAELEAQLADGPEAPQTSPPMQPQALGDQQRVAAMPDKGQKMKRDYKELHAQREALKQQMP